MNYCISDTTNQLIVNKLEEYGYKCISTEKSTDVSQPVSLHADVLYLKADNNSVYVSECQKNNIGMLKSAGYNVKTIKLSPGYKTECKLNLVVTDTLIICNPKTCMDYSEFSRNRELIYTNQGYTKCSTVVLENNNFITEDKNIYNVLTKTGKHCLLIEKGYVELEGYNYGFIGGASVYIKERKTILFTGDIRKHPDYINIKNFCDNNDISIDYIDDMNLYDIGGIIIL